MDWHALSEKEVIEKLDSSLDGLDGEEAHKRISQFGANKLKRTRHFDALKVFLNQFKSFLIIILIIAAVISFFMHSVLDSMVILVIIFLNSGLGFVQEYKAEKAIEELKKMMVPEAKVIRNGKVMRINSHEIVPGDILVLKEGDKIMADARILQSDGLKVNEAALTGESVADEKISLTLKSTIPLADRNNMVYQGTIVVSGGARAIVVDTGMNTELGKISTLVQEVQSEENPFKEKLDSFAKTIGIFILILSGIIVTILILIGGDVFQSFLVAVSLAVAAIPEGLPAVISLALALATRRMLNHNVLIRKLPASETLGRVTVICTDKTGTLTEEKMEVTSVYANGKLNPIKDKDLLLKIGILCNGARVEEDKTKGEYFIGDPTEIALIISAKNNSLDKRKITGKEPKIKEFAFTSERKMMSKVRKSGKDLISYAKGAPEVILKRCNYELLDGKKIKLDDYRRKELKTVYEGMAKKGLRVLGFAYKKLSNDNFDVNIAETELVFVGFQGMIDPPREEVKGAIKKCNDAGIKVIMITGDNRLTAEAVAKQIGLKGKSVDSIELKEMDDVSLFKEIDNISVFSRIAPEDKLRIINILKKKKEIVAMTGDGVNDALALKRADIGISMGIRGTDVARDSSDIVLLDDNFASIVRGVEEGRGIYYNTKKFIKFLLSTNFSEVFLVLVAILIWKNPELLPLLPLQILWINLITESLPALALSVEPLGDDVMRRKPRKEGILYGIKGFILFVGMLVCLTSFLMFYQNIENIDKARTMAVTMSITMQMFLVFTCKTKYFVFKSKMNKYLIYAVMFSVGLHLTALYTPLGSLFSFVYLGLMDWIKILSLAVIGFVLVEIYKYCKLKKV